MAVAFQQMHARHLRLGVAVQNVYVIPGTQKILRRIAADEGSTPGYQNRFHGGLHPQPSHWLSSTEGPAMVGAIARYSTVARPRLMSTVFHGLM